MKKENIKIAIGDTSELFSSTAELLEKTGRILENDQFSDEEGKKVVDALYEVLGENGDKMQKYLINCLCTKLADTLDNDKLETIYEKLMEEEA